MKPKLLTAAVSGTLRTASFLGQEHLVVPVVALVEGVLFATNAPAPELVLAETFSEAPQGWNGRPVMMNHPSVGGARVSANNPRLLEAGAFGSVFNAIVEDRKLKLEAWINLGRVPMVAGADDVVTRIRAGEAVEVSVGVFVSEEQKSGTHEGKPYSAIWRDIVPDHLAMLPRGTTGACSNEMGCGAPRAAAEQEETVRAAEAAQQPAKPKTWGERWAALVASFRPSQESTSDQDLRGMLEAALRAIEPGFLGVDAVFPEETLVVYAVAPTEALQLFERSYTLAADGTVTLGDTPTEVKAVTKFEPVKEPKAAAKACGCSRAAAAADKENVMAEVSKEKKARVEKLIARSKMFTAEDVALLEQVTDARLEAFEKAEPEQVASAAPVAAAPAAQPGPVAVPAAKPVEQTPEQQEEAFLATAPESVRTIVQQHKAASAARKGELVASLKAAQSVYSETDLAAMDVPALEKLAKVAVSSKPRTDFSGQAPRAASSSEGVPPAPDMTAVLKDIRAAKTA